jgi:hypothetical protein
MGIANRWELPMANHLDQSLWFANQKQWSAVRSYLLHSSVVGAQFCCVISLSKLTKYVGENQIKGSHWRWELPRFSPDIKSENRTGFHILRKVRFSWQKIKSKYQSYPESDALLGLSCTPRLMLHPLLDVVHKVMKFY